MSMSSIVPVRPNVRMILSFCFTSSLLYALAAVRSKSVREALTAAAPDDPRLVGWGAWCLTRPGEFAIAADVHPSDALPHAEIDAVLTQSGVFDAVYCWSRDGATTIEMMVRLS